MLRRRLHDGRPGAAIAEWPATAEATLWPHYRLRHEQRHDRVANSEWRYAAEHQSESGKGRFDECSSDRKSVTIGTARHEEFPVRGRRLRRPGILPRVRQTN